MKSGPSSGPRRCCPPFGNGRQGPVFDWLLAALSYQGISDQVAYDYMQKHGRATWAEISPPHVCHPRGSARAQGRRLVARCAAVGWPSVDPDDATVHRPAILPTSIWSAGSITSSYKPMSQREPNGLRKCVML